MAATRIQVAARPSVLELDTRETAVILDSPSDPGLYPVTGPRNDAHAGLPRVSRQLRRIMLAICHPGSWNPISCRSSHHAPQPGVAIIVKPRHNAFYDTELDAILKQSGVTSLIFTGGATSICVE